MNDKSMCTLSVCSILYDLHIYMYILYYIHTVPDSSVRTTILLRPMKKEKSSFLHSTSILRSRRFANWCLRGCWTSKEWWSQWHCKENDPWHHTPRNCLGAQSRFATHLPGNGHGILSNMMPQWPMPFMPQSCNGSRYRHYTAAIQVHLDLLRRSGGNTQRLCDYATLSAKVRFIQVQFHAPVSSQNTIASWFIDKRSLRRTSTHRSYLPEW